MAFESGNLAPEPLDNRLSYSFGNFDRRPVGHIRPFVQIRGRPEFFEPVRHGLNTVGILLAPKDTGRRGKFGQSIDPTLQVVFSLLLITSAAASDGYRDVR